jgi:hypothetical protein
VARQPRSRLRGRGRQSANGPCDDTVHTYYWDDDQPMMYFGDVRGRPAYCASHVVPLESLPHDLASAATTPNFAWVSPDDCSDMEGCGIRAGDDFLARELGMIMNSPAWTTQRSLAIITFDEDVQDGQHPAQRTPTIVLGSASVRQGYVSLVRYTHYSLLRTVEAALGLGALTQNDRFAQPVNDVFSSSASGAVAPSAAAPAVIPAPAGMGSVVSRGTARGSSPPTAWVANYGSATVTPVNLASRKAGKAIPVGTDPAAVVVTPDGRTVYVANEGSTTVTSIDTATRRPGPPRFAHHRRRGPRAIAMSPRTGTAYVANFGSDTVTPISLETNTTRPAIPAGFAPDSVAVTPDGEHLVVSDGDSDQAR